MPASTRSVTWRRTPMLTARAVPAPVSELNSDPYIWNLPALQKAANTTIRRIVCASYMGHKLTKGVGSGEWDLTVRSEYPLRTVEYHSPLPTPHAFRV